MFIFKDYYKALIQTLEDLEDSHSCRLDLQGDCQEHGWFNSERSCPQKRILELVIKRKYRR